MPDDAQRELLEQAVVAATLGRPGVVCVHRVLEGPPRVPKDTCWCCPYLLRPGDDAAVEQFLQVIADRPERQVS